MDCPKQVIFVGFLYPFRQKEVPFKINKDTWLPPRIPPLGPFGCEMSGTLSPSSEKVSLIPIDVLLLLSTKWVIPDIASPLASYW